MLDPQTEDFEGHPQKAEMDLEKKYYLNILLKIIAIVSSRMTTTFKKKHINYGLLLPELI